MRPVRKGPSPISTPYSSYDKALNDLISRLGMYCSYCERRIASAIEVEHIQPKSLPQYAGLIGTWSNFLLACKNCNSTKGKKNVVLSDVLLPDRDNTFAAFDYAEDGTVNVSQVASNSGLGQICADTLALTGLDKIPTLAMDTNQQIVLADRFTQRMDALLLAMECKEDLDLDPVSLGLRRNITRTARECGFFSIWMKVFTNDTDMRLRFIAEFPGTQAGQCFDIQGLAFSPAPNPDLLTDGGKI
jgi:uncharacterized protein (TIGR02646 family)